jgi:2-haloacid dehalogenase
MTTVKAVVFDVGNILIRWTAEDMLRGYFPDEAAFRAFLRRTRILWMNLAFDAGKPFAEGIAELVAKHPEHAAPLRAFDARWHETVVNAIAGNVETLRDLKAGGAPVYAITNFAREKFDVARRMHPFLDLFDHAVVSGDIGLVKPDYRIYHRLCEEVGREPEEMIFVDDSALNIAAAKAVGYEVFHMPHADAAECAAFRNRLVELGFPLRPA